MPQYIIHVLPAGTGDQTRGQPICLVECQQFVREPVIVPDTCEIIMPDKKEQSTKGGDLFRNRKQIKVTQLTGVDTNPADQCRDSTVAVEGEYSSDAQSLMRECNLISIVVTSQAHSDATPQTLELHYNLGIDRFFLVGSVCKLLMVGVLRLHQPCLDVIFGLNSVQLSENTMIYVNESVVDVYAKVDHFEHLNDRRRLAYAFYGGLPEFDRDQEYSGGGGGKTGGGGAQSALGPDPDHIVYFEMNNRRRPVALFSGRMEPCDSASFRPLTDVVNMYPKHKTIQEVGSTLYLALVMGESKNRDRRYILAHPNVTTVTVVDTAELCVCGWARAYTVFSHGSIKIAGYVALIIAHHPHQLVTGRTEVALRSGRATLYLDDHFAVVRIDSDDTAFDVDQSRSKQKELKSFSLMNINKKRYRPAGNHGYVAST